MALIPAKCTKNLEKTLWGDFIYLPSSLNSVNISQEYSDEPASKFVTDLLRDVSVHPELTDYHQYARTSGHRRLVRALSMFYSRLFGVSVQPMTEILVTGGANAALQYTFYGWIDPGDEVIIFEPAYDVYVSQIRMAGGVPVPVNLEFPVNVKRSSEFTFDLKSLERKISKKSKMIIVNNPHNPTGKLFTRKELDMIAKFADRHNLIVVADEVYEWHIHGKAEMIRFASLPKMYQRTITIGSAGIAFGLTGWKIGWAIGPNFYLTPLRAIHQTMVYTCCAPLQEALARAYEIDYDYYYQKPEKSYLKTGLVADLTRKRDRLAALFEKVNMKPILPDAGYFMMVSFAGLDDDYKKVDYNLEKSSDPLDIQFARWLFREKKIGVFPGSAFYSDKRKKGIQTTMVRVCFLRSNQLLDKLEELIIDFKRYLDAPF